MFPNALTVLADQEMNTEFVASVVLTGLVVVFAALVILVVFIALFGKGFSALTKSDKPKEKKPKQPKEKKLKVTVSEVKSLKPVTESGIDDEIIAVIAAAVSAISNETGKKLAIRSIKRADRSTNAWARAGVIENTRPF